ncbi:serine/threonine protein kinase [Chondrocystis sp. NIES-4102]|nr:serine/threonine protein kinase [Chondrocystis sp. NIES-4102]
MEIICTRPGCTNPRNFFGDLDNQTKIRNVQQRYCSTCGMPLILADRYFPSKVLGQGGFGTAFLARDRHKPKMPWCVVKQFQPATILNQEESAIAQGLFEREAEALEELGHKHPQIPDLYAFFTPIVPNIQRTCEEQYFYLAQEFIDGETLETELETKGIFSEIEVECILTEILKILEFIHQHRIIHRDIKPSNIMRNQQGVLYLLDFGAVKQIAVGASQKKSTNIHTRGFAPPEQISGAEVYPSTDLYALAATSIVLLTGKPVEELYDSFNYIWHWRNYAPQTSTRLANILDKMLEFVPAQRFQSATEVLAALETKPDTNSQPTATPSSPPVKLKTQSNFSLVEVLGSAAFTGFEGGLIYFGLTNLLSVSGISLGILGMIMGGLVYALHRRLIEKIDLAILAFVSSALFFLLPVLQGSLGIKLILGVAMISAAGAIAITAFFRLVYQLLSRIL